MKKEIKTVAFELKAMNEDENYFTFEGYASTFGNVDLGNDIIVSGAFKDTLSSNASVPILWQHDMEAPLGKSVELYEDGRGLYIKGIMPKDDDFVKGRVMPQMRIGSIREMSIGYFVKDFEYNKDVRMLKSIELFEVSLVTKAMIPKAKLTGFKALSANIELPLAPRDRVWDATAAEKRIREYTDSKDAPSSDYRKYFMYFDRENSGKFEAYKLLFSDVINGEPHIIPRAIFAIAGALEGARGGVDISEIDKVRIKRVINSLYERMAQEFDDESLVSPLKSKSFESLKDIEADLKVSGYSNSEAKTIISKIKQFSAQRDAEEEQAQRDAELKHAVMAQLNDLTNFIKLKKQ